MANDELNILLPDNVPLTLESGAVINIVPLKLRECLSLIKIIINGAGPALGKSSLFNSDIDADEYAGELIGLIISSIPNAPEDTIAFIRGMVEPTGLSPKPYAQQNKQDRESDEALWAKVYEDTYNPGLSDTISIIETILTQEADNLKSLGKQLRVLLERASKIGQSKSPAQNSSVVSVESSTLSAPSTDGATTESSTSPSPKSAKKSPQSRNERATKPEPAVVS
jgi:hypothetical protein